jgi:Leucine-rich repeat (LRR) protein
MVVAVGVATILWTLRWPPRLRPMERLILWLGCLLCVLCGGARGIALSSSAGKYAGVNVVESIQIQHAISDVEAVESPSCSGSITETAYNSLYSLYNATAGRYWVYDDRVDGTVWSFPANLSAPCTNRWQGLNCSESSASNCVIVGLNMDGMNMTGTIPSSIASLTNLRTLDLAANSLLGSIPTAIGQLTKLQLLLLESNKLTGQLPTEIAELSSLEKLWLYANQLKGTLPSELGELSNLQDITLYANSIHGSIPKELGNLLKLSTLNLESNRFIDGIPKELGQCTALETLVLSGNYMNGSLPLEIFNATKLTSLLLNNNYFVGTISPKIRQLGSLQELWLQGNRLYGQVPSNISELAQLVTLDLDANHLSGTIPCELGLLTGLKYMYLNSNYMTGSIPSELAAIVGIQSLNFYFNSLSGPIPSQFGTFSNISTLTFALNYLTQGFPTELTNAVTLGFLDMGINYLVGTLPNSINQLTKLKFILVEVNGFSGSFPSQFGELDELVYLVAYDNQLSHSIPSELGSYKQILALILSDNRLTGRVPTELFQLSTVEYLYISENSLSGSIPTSIGNLVKLIDFEAASTLMTGSIPTEIGNALELQYLEMSGGFYDGKIPTVLGSCSLLNILDVGDNYLSGSFPSEFSQLSSLTQLNVSTNSLSGSIVAYHAEGSPDSGTSTQYIIQYVDFSKNQFTGSIPTYYMNSSSLTTVIMYSNCFKGSVPSDMCIASNLQILVLDSMTSSTACQVIISTSTQKLVKGSFPRNLLSGSIPNCLWSMSKLTSLHMAGNGLGGSLGEIPSDSALTDLILSHNQLEGSVPLSIQEHGKFLQLDLSFNKLTNTLSESFKVSANATTFDLTVNRLSDKIPSAIVHASTVNVLQGNIFQCQEGSSKSIPRNDPEFEMYICGSSNYNRCLLLWCIICGGLICVYFVSRSLVGGRKFGGNVAKFMYMKAVRYATAFHILPKGLKARFTSDFLYLMRRFCVLACLLCILYVFVGMMSYIVLKSGNHTMSALYSTYSTQYTWVTTSAYMHGAVPATLILLYLYFTVYVMNAMFAYAYIIDYEKQRLFAYGKLTAKALSFNIPVAANGSGNSSSTSKGDPNSKAVPVAGVSKVNSSDSMEDGHRESGGGNSDGSDGDRGSGGTASQQSAGSLNLSVSNLPFLLENTSSAAKSTSLKMSNSGDGAVNNSDRQPHGDVNLGDATVRESYRKSATTASSTPTDCASWLTTQSIMRVMHTFVIQFIYAAITVVVNVGYVYLALSSSISPQTLNWIQFLMGIFKLWYNAMVKPWVIHRCLPFLNKSQQLLHMTFMSLFTFIAGPLIATFVTHSDCFYYAIFGEAEITSSFTQPEVTCHSLCLSSSECLEICDKAILEFESITVTTSIAPPWLYSYQCSSALLTNFLPVLVLTFLLSGIVIPTFLYVVTLYRIQLRKRSRLSNSQPSNGLQVPMLDASTGEASSTAGTANGSGNKSTETVTVTNPIASSVGTTKSTANEINQVSGRAESASTSKPAAAEVDVIGVPTLMSKMILNAAVLMTYGLASPLLGITVAIDGVIVSVFWRGYVENYCRVENSDVDDSDNATKDVNTVVNNIKVGEKLLALERSTCTCGAGLRGSMTMVVIFLCVFWSMTMLDMFGDVYGAVVGVCCLLLSLVGLPLFHNILQFYYRYRMMSDTRNDAGVERRTTLTSIELLMMNSVERQAAEPRIFDVELANSDF